MPKWFSILWKDTRFDQLFRTRSSRFCPIGNKNAADSQGMTNVRETRIQSENVHRRAAVRVTTCRPVPATCPCQQISLALLLDDDAQQPVGRGATRGEIKVESRANCALVDSRVAGRAEPPSEVKRESKH